ncbi:MAG: hypothetical protein WKF47_01600 [Geodermatophilaceae bacterium]
MGNRHSVTRWWYDVSARTVTPADAETSAFAERPAQRPVGDRRTAGRVGAARIAAGRGTTGLRRRRVEAEPRRLGERSRSGQRVRANQAGDPGPAPAATDDEREHRARIPSWEDIVFGVRRKRS